MPDTLSSTRRFRLRILACMLKPRFMTRYGTIILPTYFDNEDEHNVCTALLEYWKRYKRTPDSDDLVELMDGQHKSLIQSLYLGLEEWDLSLAEDNVVTFAKEQAAKLAVLNSLADIEKGNLATVMERLKEAMLVGQDLEDVGLDLKEGLDSWVSQAQVEKVPTGLVHLDIALEGGLARGELGVILAPPNYGKSMALINIGSGAIGPISATNVVHFTYEMADHVVAKRYGARATFRFPNRSGSLEEYKAKFWKAARLLLPGNVRIFYVSGDVNVLRAKLNMLLDTGFIPGLIIVDYGDLVKPVRGRQEHWIELGETFQALRSLGSEEEYDCPVWTATQTTRSAVNKEIITMSDLAESWQKAAVADVIVAICQTAEEESNDVCRLFTAKIRDSASRAVIAAKFYKSEQAIITTGFTQSGAITESVKG